MANSQDSYGRGGTGMGFRPLGYARGGSLSYPNNFDESELSTNPSTDTAGLSTSSVANTDSGTDTGFGFRGFQNFITDPIAQLGPVQVDPLSIGVTTLGILAPPLAPFALAVNLGRTLAGALGSFAGPSQTNALGQTQQSAFGNETIDMFGNPVGSPENIASVAGFNPTTQTFQGPTGAPMGPAVNPDVLTNNFTSVMGPAVNPDVLTDDFSAQADEAQAADPTGVTGDAYGESTASGGGDPGQADSSMGGVDGSEAGAAGGFANGGFAEAFSTGSTLPEIGETKSDLSDPGTTATEFLLINSNELNLSGRVDPFTQPGSVNAGLFLDLKNRTLPSASISGSGGGGIPKSASLSIGSDLLRFSKRFDNLSEGEMTTDTFEGGVGPLRGYYQQSTQPGNQDSRTTAFGGQLNLGPVNVYANRNRSSQDVVDPSFAQYFNNPRLDNQTDRLGVRGSVPLGQGTLTGGVERQFSTDKYPQQMGQETRPTGQSPNVTTYGAGYKGTVGSGILSLQGNLIDVRNLGTENSIQGSYDLEDPFGLGGKLSATGSSKNPMGGKSSSEAGLQYKVPFGGGR